MKNIRSKKAATARKYNTNVPAQRAGESAFDYSQRLAKMADTRLRRLEKLSKESGFENVTRYAYANAMHDIKSLYGGGKTFQRRAKKTKAGAYNEKQIQAQISAVKRFLESPTSTKGGIKKVYKGRADTINSRYGTNFTWEDMGKFFESGLAEKLDTKYASKTNMKAIGIIQRNDLKTVEDVKKYRDSIEVSSDQQVVLNRVESILSQYGDDVRDLFFK